jgi:CBF/Mak21 family
MASTVAAVRSRAASLAAPVAVSVLKRADDDLKEGLSFLLGEAAAADKNSKKEVRFAASRALRRWFSGAMASQFDSDDEDSEGEDSEMNDEEDGGVPFLLCWQSSAGQKRLRKRVKEGPSGGERGARWLWLLEQYCAYIDSLLETAFADVPLPADRRRHQIAATDEEKQSYETAAVDSLMHFLQLESALKKVDAEQRESSVPSGASFFAADLFARIMRAAIAAPLGATVAVAHLIGQHVVPYDDVRYFALKAISAAVRGKGDSVATGDEAGSHLANRVAGILAIVSAGMGPLGREVTGESLLDDVEDSDDDGDSSDNSDDAEMGSGDGAAKTPKQTGNKKRKAGERERMRDPKTHRKLYEACWLSLLKMPRMSEGTLAMVLRALPESVLPRLKKPHLVLDFLLAAFRVGGSLAVLSLGSLFIMVTHYNFDFPKFYEHVYAWLSRDGTALVHALHAGAKKEDDGGSGVSLLEFLQQLEVFLSSPLLPRYLVAAFLKRLARIALYSPPAGAHGLLVLCYGLLQRQPSVRALVHRPAAATNTAKVAPGSVLQLTTRAVAVDVKADAAATVADAPPSAPSRPAVSDRDAKRKRLQNPDYRAALVIGSGATDTVSVGLAAEKAAARKRSASERAGDTSSSSSASTADSRIAERAPGASKRARPEATNAVHSVHSAPAESTPSTPTNADPFDDLTSDPKAANAALSSLWEVQTLRSHYDAGVSRVSRLVLESGYESQIPVASALAAANADSSAETSAYTHLVRTELAKRGGGTGVPLVAEATHRLLGPDFSNLWHPFAS